MHERDVEKRQKLFLIFKSQFFAKLNHMESNGKNQDVLVKIHNHIEKNLDTLFDKHLKFKNSIPKNVLKEMKYKHSH